MIPCQDHVSNTYIKIQTCVSVCEDVGDGFSISVQTL